MRDNSVFFGGNKSTAKSERWIRMKHFKFIFFKIEGKCCDMDGY